MDFTLPDTRYALSGDVSIAYQVIGDGPVDIIAVPGLTSHIEFMHEFPGYTAFLRRLAKFARVVVFDKRGQGLSDRILRRAIVGAAYGRCPRRYGRDRLAPRDAPRIFRRRSDEHFVRCDLPGTRSHLVLFGGFARAADLRPSGDTADAAAPVARCLSRIGAMATCGGSCRKSAEPNMIPMLAENSNGFQAALAQ